MRYRRISKHGKCSLGPKWLWINNPDRIYLREAIEKVLGKKLDKET